MKVSTYAAADVSTAKLGRSEIWFHVIFIYIVIDCAIDVRSGWI
jgi:hypothetical protein